MEPVADSSGVFRGLFNQQPTDDIKLPGFINLGANQGAHESLFILEVVPLQNTDTNHSVMDVADSAGGHLLVAKDFLKGILHLVGTLFELLVLPLFQGERRRPDALFQPC